MAAFDQIIPKIHDLRVLVELVAQQDDHFATNAEAAEWLSPFATEFRYPSDSPDPSVDDAQRAESLATEILEVVESWLRRRESS